jgi:hypothetical protein
VYEDRFLFTNLEGITSNEAGVRLGVSEGEAGMFLLTAATEVLLD